MFGYNQDACKSAKAFMDIIKKRRSVYDVGSDLPISQNFIVSCVKETIKHIPTSFNSQTNRALVLFGKSSSDLWKDTVWNFIKSTFPAERHQYFEGRMNNFKSGAGTVLFYIDTAKVEEMQTKFPNLKSNFPIWARDSSAMAQYALWSTLSASDVGASLQHYTQPPVKKEIDKMYDIPPNWELVALMPFGNIKTPPGEKSFVNIDDCVKVSNGDKK